MNKFRPERPIYLNEQNTGYKTRAEVDVKVEELRSKGWLAQYNEKQIPPHMSFDDETVFNEFKQACKELKITLRGKVQKPQDFDDLDAELEGTKVPGAEDKESAELDGKPQIP